MKFLFASILILTSSTYVYAGVQPDFNGANPESSYDAGPTEAEGRLLFPTVTLSVQTWTVTTTTTAVTTCTTSTGALSVCTASGRRRRGLHLSGNKQGRGLFYNEDDEHNENGNVFLPLPKVDDKPVQQAIESVDEVQKSSEPIPFVVQPGFEAPVGKGRFLFVFGATTTTSTSTTTSTATLTAICISTTGYQVCSFSGK